MTIGAAQHGKPRRRIRALVFDLVEGPGLRGWMRRPRLAWLSHARAYLSKDDTLYRCPGISKDVLAGIQGFMCKHLGYTHDQAVAKATELYLGHGTTLAGLVATGCTIDFDQWHREVHYEHVKYELHIKADVALRELLFSMDLPKYVFTNADAKHAAICLRLLGIEDAFQGVFHFENLHELADAAGIDTPEHPAVVCKPSHRAYELVFAKIGVPASEVLFFDDSMRNVKAAQEVGAMTVLVGTSEKKAGADLSMLDLHALPKMLPELIDQPGLIKEVAPGHEHENMIEVGDTC